MEKIWEEIGAFITKFWIFPFLILVGLLGKIGQLLQETDKPSFLKIVGSLLTAIFVGIVASIICVQNDAQDTSIWLVPIVTVTSEKIMALLMSVNYKKWLADKMKEISDKLNK